MPLHTVTHHHHQALFRGGAAAEAIYRPTRTAEDEWGDEDKAVEQIHAKSRFKPGDKGFEGAGREGKQEARSRPVEFEEVDALLDRTCPIRKRVGPIWKVVHLFGACALSLAGRGRGPVTLPLPYPYLTVTSAGRGRGSVWSRPDADRSAQWQGPRQDWRGRRHVGGGGRLHVGARGVRTLIDRICAREGLGSEGRDDSR